MSDEEMDQDWKPSNRPQSTMARSFSLALNDLFKIDNSLADLDAAVSEKKQKVSSQTSELEALEARLKATEERLKAASSSTSPSRNGRSSPRPRPPLGDIFSQPSPTRTSQTSPLAQEFTRPATASRPKTGQGEGKTWKQEAHTGREAPPMPGALPPTPGASEGESESAESYVFVERGRESKTADLLGKDGDANQPPPPPPKSTARYTEDSD